MTVKGNRRVLITGGAGFIASHIVNAYVQEGYRVVVLDNLSTGKKTHVHTSAHFVRGDITDERFVQSVFIKHGPFQLVNHHAAQRSVSTSISDPHFDATVNILGSLNILRAVNTNKIPHLIYASTGGAIYDTTRIRPATENGAIAPLSPYGVSKYAAELYMLLQRQQRIIQILRYSNVYGPRQDPAGEAGVIAIFCDRLRKNKPLVIHGSGRQTRDFVMVHDVAKANVTAARHARSGIWNIATGQEISIRETARKLTTIALAHGFTPTKITYQPPHPGEVKRSSLSYGRAARDFKWRPTTSLLDGLETTFRSFLPSKPRRDGAIRLSLAD